MEKWLIWFIFSVLVALTPLFLTRLISLLTRIEAASPRTVFDKGELLLVSAALCAASIGDLLGSSFDATAPSTLKVYVIIAIGASLLVLLLCSYYFADIYTAQAAGVNVNLSIIRRASIVFFTVAFVSSGSCIALSTLIAP